MQDGAILRCADTANRTSLFGTADKAPTRSSQGKPVGRVLPRLEVPQALRRNAGGYKVVHFDRCARDEADHRRHARLPQRQKATLVNDDGRPFCPVFLRRSICSMVECVVQAADFRFDSRSEYGQTESRRLAVGNFTQTSYEPIRFFDRVSTFKRLPTVR